MSVERLEVFNPRRVEPVPWEVEAPARTSVTLVKKADVCPRDAGLYLRYGGGSQTGPLIRGTLAHAFAERLMAHLMLHGEQSLFAPGFSQAVDHRGIPTGGVASEAAVAAAEQVSQTTKEWVNSLVEELDLPIAEADLDDVRQVAYHLAIGQDVNPEHVIAVERKFVLETPDGTLSGKVDLAALPPNNVLDVLDYKTSFYIPPEDDYSKLLQAPLYAALILWGRPVDKVPCPACESPVPEPCTECAGRGTVEVLGDPLGLDHVQWVRARQSYPRFLRDGKIPFREVLLGRADLRDKVEAAQRAMRRVTRGVEDRIWPAVSGSHCAECTCEAECPLPRQLRRFAGAIETPEQASEAMEWAERQGSLVTATKKQVTGYVKANDQELGGELPVGNRTYAFHVSFPKSLKKAGSRSDWEGLSAALEDAAFNGAVFDLDDWVRPGKKTDFKPKKESD